MLFTLKTVQKTGGFQVRCWTAKGGRQPMRRRRTSPLTSWLWSLPVSATSG